MDLLSGNNTKTTSQKSGSGGGIMDTLHGAVGGGPQSEKNEGTLGPVDFCQHVTLMLIAQTSLTRVSTLFRRGSAKASRVTRMPSSKQRTSKSLMQFVEATRARRAQSSLWQTNKWTMTRTSSNVPLASYPIATHRKQDQAATVKVFPLKP